MYIVLPAAFTVSGTCCSNFQRKVNSHFSGTISSVFWACVCNPPSLQALLSRGITELLMTSDGEGFRRGALKGGIVTEAHGQTRLHTHTHTYTHARTHTQADSLCERSEPSLVSGSFSRIKKSTHKCLCCSREFLFSFFSYSLGMNSFMLKNRICIFLFN